MNNGPREKPLAPLMNVQNDGYMRNTVIMDTVYYRGAYVAQNKYMFAYPFRPLLYYCD